MIRAAWLSLTLALWIVPPAVGHADGPPKWDKESASKEIDGMRRYTLALADRISGGMKQADAAKYPGVQAFLQQSSEALAAIDREKAPMDWPELKLDDLISHNPIYWRAYYEVRPGDPLMMWLHACYYGINGDLHRALYVQSLAVRTGVDTPLKAEMPRLIVSTNRAINLCRQQVQQGIKHHDAEAYAESEAIYRDVLEVCPKHSSALYELGYTLNNASRKAGKRDDSISQPYYDQARKHDPFMISAYQGSFTPESFRQMGKLRSAAIPNWTKMMTTPTTQIKREQLETLSTSLHQSGLHELALIARQAVVSRQPGGYSDEDVNFIMTCLTELLPGNDLGSIKASLTGVDVPRLQIRFADKD